MPIYVFKCADPEGHCGYRFEHLGSFDASAPGCPACGGATRKIPAGFSLGGQANAGLTKEQMPQTWRGTYNGSREYVTGLRRQWDRRQQVEAKHPELAGDQRPIIAHEGRFHDAPLRQGDQVIGTTGPGTGHGHGGHGASPAPPPAATPTSGPTGGSPGGGTH